ncbi:DUF4861 domain-containing protein [candidate division KSB1 bacterium]|nr:DUF4861 domain-containing protein [candidate division KSB1 bacterium]
MKKLFVFMSIIILVTGCNQNSQNDSSSFPGVPELKWSKRLPVEVTNPVNTSLKNVPVIVPVSEFQLGEMNFVETGHFRVYDVETGEMPLYQVDDLDGDGTKADEIVFLSSLKAGETRQYEIRFYNSFKAWPQQSRFTDATDMPGWESELFGYRSYGPFVIDMFGKYKSNPGLRLKTFYNESNKQIYNYHVDSKLGMDILHVGPTVGLGGVALKTETEVFKPSSGSLNCRVVVSGPVRSIVEMKKENWHNDIGTFNVTRTATIYAHHFETQIHDEIAVLEISASPEAGIGTGMKKEENMHYQADSSKGLYLLWHNQAMYDIGDMGFGLYFDVPDNFSSTEDDKNYYYLFEDKMVPGKVLKYNFVAFGAWKRAGYVNNMNEFRQFAGNIITLQTPVTVNLKALEKN